MNFINKLLLEEFFATIAKNSNNIIIYVRATLLLANSMCDINSKDTVYVVKS